MSQLLPPIFPDGHEPVPPGTTQEEIDQARQMKQFTKYMGYGMESCVFKGSMAGVMGFGLGAFFSLMSTSFQYEDPLNRSNVQISTLKQTKLAFKDMGQKMVSSGKGFGKVGLVFAGVECCVEGYRAKNDLWNSALGGLLAGGILAFQAGGGPRSVVLGGGGFAAFSTAIDAYMRKEPPDED